MVANAAKESMKTAIERVKESPHCATSGEVRVAALKKKIYNCTILSIVGYN